MVGIGRKMADYKHAFDVVLKEAKLNSLKEKQIEILETILNNNNCLAILPTGYGKSLPYQLYLQVIRALGDNWSKKKNSKVIVCCPLASIMEDQVNKLKQMTCFCRIFSSPEADSSISNGEVDLIYGSPELLVGNLQRREIIQKLGVSLIVIDEFHTIATWGGMGNEEDAFRKWFRHLGDLRSMFPNAVVLALSATCTKIIEKRVLNVLGIDKKTTKSIRLSPNKENIKFVVKKVPNSAEAAMFWLMEALNNLKVKFPRTVIYCNSIKDVSAIYNFLTSEIPDAANFVDMFHSETPSNCKSEIIDKLGNENSLRIVLATSALGMGLDVKYCNSVIIYGPSVNIADLIQEIGRLGRDGLPSVAVVLYNSYQCKQLDTEVKTFLRTDVCRRQTLMENFHSSAEMKTVKMSLNQHHCCDICAKLCSCGQCISLPIEKLLNCVTSEDTSEDTNNSSDSETISYFYESYSEQVLELSDNDD